MTLSTGGGSADFSQLYTIPILPGTPNTAADPATFSWDTPDPSWDLPIPDSGAAVYNVTGPSYTVPQLFRPDMDPVLVKCTAPVTVTWS